MVVAYTQKPKDYAMKNDFNQISNNNPSSSTSRLSRAVLEPKALKQSVSNDL
jgi:hypothetical protein